MRRISDFLKALGVYLVVTSLFGCGGSGSQGEPGGVTVTQTIPAQTALTISGLPSVSVEVTSATFTAPTTVTVTEYESVFSRPVSAAIDTAGPLVNVRLSRTLDGPLRVSFPNTGGVLQAAVKIGNEWWPLQGQVEQNRFVAALEPENALRTQEDGSVVTEFLVFLGKLASNQSITPKLVSLRGSGYQNIALIVPGWCDRTASFQALADFLVERGYYTAVYGLEYDWRQSIVGTANATKALLDELRLQTGNKKVDVIAHSMGGLVARQTFEVLGATHAVRRLICVNTPHQGSRFSHNDINLFKVLSNIYLGTFYAFGWPELTTPSLGEVAPNSGFLSALNSGHGQTGQIDYLLIGSVGDLAVGLSSARADELTIQNFTAGLPIRRTVTGSHSDLVKNPARFSELAELINASLPAPSGVRFEMTPSVVAANYDHWRYELAVTNDSAAPVVITAIQMMLFDANGAWRGTWWFQPTSGEFFPSTYHAWNQPLGPGFSERHNILVYTDLDKTPLHLAPPERQRQTAIMVAYLRRSTGAEFTLQSHVICTYNGLWPEPAQTRSIGDRHEERVGGFIRAP